MRKVRVSIEVRNGAACFGVAVQAESIPRAMSLVAGRYPDHDIRAKFPIDPEGFLVKELPAQAGIAEFEQPKKMVA